MTERAKAEDVALLSDADLVYALKMLTITLSNELKGARADLVHEAAKRLSRPATPPVPDVSTELLEAVSDHLHAILRGDMAEAQECGETAAFIDNILGSRKDAPPAAPQKEPTGTSQCPLCNESNPHRHDDEFRQTAASLYFSLGHEDDKSNIDILLAGLRQIYSAAKREAALSSPPVEPAAGVERAEIDRIVHEAFVKAVRDNVVIYETIVDSITARFHITRKPTNG